MCRANEAAASELATEKARRQELEVAVQEMTARLAAADREKAAAAASAMHLQTALADEQSKVSVLRERIAATQAATAAERQEAVTR